MPSRVAIGAAAGIFAGSLAHGLVMRPEAWVAPVACGLALAALAAKRAVTVGALLGFAFAFAVFDAHIAALSRVGTLPEGERLLSGTVIGSEESGMAVRTLLGDVLIRAADGEVAFPARVQADFELGTGVVAGDRIGFACRLREAVPPSISRDRAIAERIGAVCSGARLVGSLEGGDAVTRAVFRARQALVLSIGKALPSPESELGAGLVFGSAAAPLPRAVMDRFRRTGTSHIVAASGYNVAVVAAWCATLLSGIGLRRRTASLAGIASIWVYASLAGFAPPVVRAATMASMVGAAGTIGRESRPLRSLALATAAMLAFSPELLLFDVGFELTVAATAGLVLLGPALSDRFPRVLSGGPLRKILSETVAATASTLPIALWRFGMLSPVAIVANLAIVPLVAPAMALSAFAVAAGFLPSYVAVVGLAAWTPLAAILAVAEALSRLPYASLSVGEFPWWGAVACYGLMAFAFTKRSPQSEPELGEYEGWSVESA